MWCCVVWSFPETILFATSYGRCDINMNEGGAARGTEERTEWPFRLWKSLNLSPTIKDEDRTTIKWQQKAFGGAGEGIYFVAPTSGIASHLLSTYGSWVRKRSYVSPLLQKRTFTYMYNASPHFANANPPRCSQDLACVRACARSLSCGAISSERNPWNSVMFASSL